MKEEKLSHMLLSKHKNLAPIKIFFTALYCLDSLNLTEKGKNKMGKEERLNFWGSEIIYYLKSGFIESLIIKRYFIYFQSRTLFTDFYRFLSS